MNEHTPHNPNPTTRRTGHTPPRPLDHEVEARMARYQARSLTPARRRAIDGLESRLAPELPPVPPLPNTVAQMLELTSVVRGGAPLRAFAAAIAAGVPVRELVGIRFESTVAGVRAVTVNGVVWPLVDLTGHLGVVVGMEAVDGDWQALRHVAKCLGCDLNAAIAARTFHERVRQSGRPLAELTRRHRLTIDTVNGTCRWLPAADIANERATRQWLSD